MHVIIWEYQVQPGRESDFETAYGPEGPWVKLFRQSDGYQGTELLSGSVRYATIDRWESAAHYSGFLDSHVAEYRRIDAECDLLTIQERLVGSYELMEQAFSRPRPLSSGRS